MTAAFFYHSLAQVKPRDAIIVWESPSNLAQFHGYVRSTLPATFFLSGSGGLGFALPAAVGLCLAERDTRRARRVIAIVGDGSAQYSIQALWTAAQLDLPVLFVVLRDPKSGDHPAGRKLAQNTAGQQPHGCPSQHQQQLRSWLTATLLRPPSPRAG